MVQSGKNKCCLAIYFVVEFVQYVQLSCSDYTVFTRHMQLVATVQSVHTPLPSGWQ